MIEPAAYGAAVLFGPNTFNFQAVVSELLSRDAARVVQDGAGLQEVFLELLSNPGKATELGERARSFVLSQQGATRKTVDLLTGLDCVSGRAKAA